MFFPWQIALYGGGTLSYAVGAGAYVLKLALAGFSRCSDRHGEMRVFRSAVPRCGLHAGLARHLLLFVSGSF